MKNLSFTLLCLCFSLATHAQEGLRYQRPVEEIAALVEAPSSPAVSFSPDRSMMAFLERAELPSIEEVSRPELRIAGLRIDPNNFGPSRSSYYTGLQLRATLGAEAKAPAGLPNPLLMSDLSWSPDGKQLAFLQNEADAITLWVVDVATRQARQLSARPVNRVLGSSFSWLSSSDALIFSVRLADEGPAPRAKRVPTGPIVEENIGKKAPSRTYQDLLKNSDDEALFEYYASSELLRVDLNGGLQLLGEKAIWRSFDNSPNDAYVLRSRIQRPYSYLVPWYRFAQVVELTDARGKLVQVLAEKPLGEDIPTAFNAVEEGPRAHAWRPDVPASLYWVEALDGGDPRQEVEHRDKLMLLEAPFTGSPRELVRTGLRYGGVLWGPKDFAWVRASWWRTRMEQTYELRPSKPGSAQLISERSYEDAYGDPGQPMMQANASGRSVLWIEKGKLFLSGNGASPAGDLPFLDSYDLKSRQSKRLWRCEAPYYERVVTLLDPAKGSFISSRESQQEPPNYFIRQTGKQSLQALTQFEHPYPQLRQVQKEQWRYPRADGLELTANLYLPPGYDSSQGPLPTLVWAYPREFKTQAAASQVKGSPYRFTRISTGSPIYWVLRGYAVLDNASMPIVGEGEQEPNDTYVKQLVANAQAIIDYGAARGIVDPARVAVGGHSYGAFMTANLLAHSDLFKAGIARSGAYNRTLTPFGFQAEERTYWQAPEVYYQMSPFSFADRIKTPLLIIHGEADNNSGTFPIQSERLYQAIKGHGGTARYVVLPHESHGYRASESVLHMLWEMDRWLEKYLVDF